MRETDKGSVRVLTTDTQTATIVYLLYMLFGEFYA